MTRTRLALLPLLLVFAACNDGNGPTTVVVTPSFILVAFDDAGDLYSLDEASGAQTMRLDTSYDPGTGAADIGRVSASTWVPARNELWIGGGGNSGCPACILALNLTTGAATLLFDNSAINSAIPDLALRPSDGAIFTTEADGSGFRSVNNTTGELTNINSATASGSGNGLTFDATETLYMTADNLLCIVDPVTGIDAVIAALSLAGFPALAGTPKYVALTTRPSDGVVFVLVKDGGNKTDTYLGTVNLTTAEVTLVGKTTTAMEGLAFVPDSVVP